MTKLDHPSYALLRQTMDGKPVTVARLTCAKCGAQFDITIRSGINHQEIVAAAARRLGWSYHARTPAKCACRQCYLGPADKPSDGFIRALGPADKPSDGFIRALGPADKPSDGFIRAKVEALADHFSPRTTAKEQPMKSDDSTGPRTPTPAEKMKIREFLDGNYDERLKAYVEPGTTDRTAGEMLNVPFSWVRDLREVAYGPLEGDAELMEIRAELNKLAARLTKAEERFRGR